MNNGYILDVWALKYFLIGKTSNAVRDWFFLQARDEKIFVYSSYLDLLDENGEGGLVEEAIEIGVVPLDPDQISYLLAGKYSTQFSSNGASTRTDEDCEYFTIAIAKLKNHTIISEQRPRFPPEIHEIAKHVDVEVLSIRILEEKLASGLI